MKYSYLKQIQLYAIGIIIYTFLQTIVIHRLDFSWNISFVDALVSAFVTAFYVFDLIIIFTFYQPGQNNHIYRILFSIAFAALTGITSQWILSLLLSQHVDYIFFIEKTLLIRSLFSLLILTFISIMFWFSNLLNEQQKKEKQRTGTEKMIKEAELASLRQKLQPHFLFNSLNSINALTISKPEEARKMIQQLSEFLRGTLKKDEQKPITLKEELTHLNLYLDIEKVRFGHRLDIEQTISEEALLCFIPPLLIQPIIENAIKYGLYQTTEKTSIKINALKENNMLVIEVINPYDSTIPSSGGSGFGLEYVQRRLFLLYARNDLLAIEKANNIFTTKLRIPQSLQA